MKAQSELTPVDRDGAAVVGGAVVLPAADAVVDFSAAVVEAEAAAGLLSTSPARVQNFS